MRKLLALTAILCFICIAAYFTACNNNKVEAQADTNKEDSLKKSIAHGDYLVNHVALCIDCHSERDYSKYSGPVKPGTEGMGGEAFTPGMGVPGTVYAKNITPDSETGIGTWTDDEILRAMTQGITKTGDTLFPIMPYPNFNRMAKEDLMDIIAYIRRLKPVKNKVQARQLMIPIALAYPGRMLQPSVDGNVRPPETDIVKYGGYMTTFSSCGECHTPMTPQGPDFSRMFAGGHTFDNVLFKVTSANITPDSTTGIGMWTEDKFMTKFLPYREEKNYNFDAGKQNTIMPLAAYAGMKDSDLKAIYAYLRTVRAVSNKIEKYPK